MSLMNPDAFIYGIDSSLQDAGFVNADDLCGRTGGNTGNLAFHYAISRQLGLRNNTPWSRPKKEIEAAGRLAVMPCANQVGTHVDMAGSARKVSDLDVSIVAIGLGAQGKMDFTVPEVPEGTRLWLKAIAERAPNKGQPNIAVRGPFSKKVIDKQGLEVESVAIGCPTLFINPSPNLGRRLCESFKTPSKICVVAGHYRWKHLSKIEASLANIATVTGGGYVAQSPKEMVQIARGETDSVGAEVLNQCRDFACPHLSPEEFLRWSHRHGEVFFDVASWMSYYRRFDFVIGMRIHGVMLALQAGVPAVCIAHDSRTRELCEFMGVPHVLASKVISGIHRDQLADFWDMDMQSFDANRLDLAGKYGKFLNGNGLKSDLLDRMLTSI